MLLMMQMVDALERSPYEHDGFLIGLYVIFMIFISSEPLWYAIWIKSLRPSCIYRTKEDNRNQGVCRVTCFLWCTKQVKRESTQSMKTLLKRLASTGRFIVTQPIKLCRLACGREGVCFME